MKLKFRFSFTKHDNLKKWKSNNSQTRIDTHEFREKDCFSSFHNITFMKVKSSRKKGLILSNFTADMKSQRVFLMKNAKAKRIMDEIFCDIISLNYIP
jgi:hypothetical protein